MKTLSERWLKPIVFSLALLPLIWMIYGLFTDSLGANPIDEITDGTGQWALRFLLITLALTPLRLVFGWTRPVRYRRMLGLFTFFYAVLHFITYIWLDQFFDWTAMLDDVIERPFITVGFFAFVLLIPLALTSTKGMMRRLGKAWKRLHKAVYVIGVATVVHFFWVVKFDTQEPMIYAGILAILLGVRGWDFIKKHKALKFAMGLQTN